MNVKTLITETTDNLVTSTSMPVKHDVPYASPEISILAIEVEQGVAASTEPWDREEL